MPPQSLVRWPDDLRPERCAIHAYNELQMDAPAERVWAWLVRAPLWRRFYANAWRVSLPAGAGPDLALGMTFSWITFGVPVTTTVVELEPGARLAWRGAGAGAQGYHGWVIEPTEAGGCRVVTEETQRGVIPTLARPLLRPGLLHFHQRWLEGLARVAREGMPPDR